MLQDLQMKRLAAVIGTKKKELPILVTELAPYEGLDMCLGNQESCPHASSETPGF